MKPESILILTLLILAGNLMGQSSSTSTGAINGVVLDWQTNEPLPYVNITVVGTSSGTITDQSGSFSIAKLPPGNYSLSISFVGYAKVQIEDLTVVGGTTLDVGQIELRQATISLAEVVVTPGSFSVMGNMPASRQTLSEDDIRNMSYAEDITRVVARLPGISSNDFSSKFTIRGGESNEVLMILDGMELYEPFHQRDFAGGLFSIVDVEAIQGIDLLTGGFPAEYGNRQSGVFNMNTRQLREGKRKSSVGLSIMNARLYTEGNFNGTDGSYIVSARRGVLDQFFQLIGEEENTPTFYDLMGKVEYKLNATHTISVHALHAGDKTAVRDGSRASEAHDIHDTKSASSYGWANLKSIHNPKLYSKVMAYGGLITHDRNGDAEKHEYSDKVDFELHDQRGYAFGGMKGDLNWVISDRVAVKTGIDLRQLNADYDYTLSLIDTRIDSNEVLFYANQNIDIQKKPSGQQLNTYLSGKVMVVPKLFVEAGIRYDYASYAEDKLLSPRIGFAYAFTGNTILRGAWGQYYQSQFINNLDVNHANVNDDWNTFNPAELSTHYVLGLEHLLQNGISMRVEGYYKDISNLSATYQNLRDPWEIFPESRNDLVRLDIDAAAAAGLELFLKYDLGGKISWWFSYALAKAEEDIKNIEFDGIVGKKTGVLPRESNQLHTVYADVNYRPNATWHFNLSWHYYVGWHYTRYQYDVQLDSNGDRHFYPEHTEFRGAEYPPYHRMDVRINRLYRLQKSTITAYLHIVNLYNRENLRKFDLDVTGDSEEPTPDGAGGYIYFRDDQNWFGLFPAIGVRWDF
ncbi:carboxypeptidase-like regulatory domain-containing protein [Candidatus Neomarinimicrobiota bacterium]